jgi:hypothetical protein
MIFSGADKAPGLLQKPVSTPPPQPDALTTASTMPTMIFSGRGAGLIEPHISSSPDASAIQSESVPSPSFPEGDDRIVVEPLYPRPSTLPTQHIRENIHPAMLGIAAIVLIVFLGGLLWWNFGKADRFPEDADAPPPTLSYDPLQDPDPILTLSTTAPPEENTPPASDPEPASEPEHEPESEPGLMNIPSLPMNQQQGRHNRHDLPEITDDKPLSSHQPPASVPAAPVSAPVQKQAAPARAEPDEIPAPVEEATYPEAGAPASAPAAIDSRPATPPWLRQMQRDLLNCRNFFCRERVRAQYCTSQWEDLPECRGASL